ncbi:MAG TPA: hypothetical protein ENG62_00285 [Thermoplasmatales archaeon]|nr:hypothetical protein [Thermoplasmatales archaeon]
MFNDKHFICERCHQHLSNEELEQWKHSVMGESKSGMPIAVWLIHEQNKDKPFMTIKRREE